MSNKQIDESKFYFKYANRKSLAIAVLSLSLLFVYQNCADIDLNKISPKEGPQCTDPVYSIVQGVSGSNVVFYLLQSIPGEPAEASNQPVTWTYEGVEQLVSPTLAIGVATAIPASGCQSREVVADFKTACNRDLSVDESFNLGPDCEEPEEIPPVCVPDAAAPVCVNGTLMQSRSCFPAGPDCDLTCDPVAVGTCATPPEDEPEPVCGNYQIKKEQINPITLRFTLVEVENGQETQITSGISWTGDSGPLNFHSYDVDLRNGENPCGSISVAATFTTSECPVAQTRVMSFQKDTECPPVITNPNPTCLERHKLPHRGTLPSEYIRRGDHNYVDANSLPVPARRMFCPFPPTGFASHSLAVQGNTFYVFEFKTPNVSTGYVGFIGASMGSNIHVTLDPNQPYAGVSMASISDCPGDFYVSRPVKPNCLRMLSETSGVEWQINTNTQSSCSLEPNKTYYLSLASGANKLPFDVDGDGEIGSEEFKDVNWMLNPTVNAFGLWVANMYTIDLSNSNDSVNCWPAP